MDLRIRPCRPCASWASCVRQPSVELKIPCRRAVLPAWGALRVFPCPVCRQPIEATEQQHLMELPSFAQKVSMRLLPDHQMPTGEIAIIARVTAGNLCRPDRISLQHLRPCHYAEWQRLVQ